MATKKRLGTHKMTVELISIPVQRGMLSVKPPVNVVSFEVETKTKTIVIYQINFEDKKSAKEYYNQVKQIFNV